VNDATRSVEEAPWRAVDRPRRCGFDATVRTHVVAMIVDLLMLIAASVGG